MALRSLLDEGYCHNHIDQCEPGWIVPMLLYIPNMDFQNLNTSGVPLNSWEITHYDQESKNPCLLHSHNIFDC